MPESRPELLTQGDDFGNWLSGRTVRPPTTIESDMLGHDVTHSGKTILTATVSIPCRRLRLIAVSAEHPKQCSLQLENYIECLHHRKEVHPFTGGRRLMIESADSDGTRRVGETAESRTDSKGNKGCVER